MAAKKAKKKNNSGLASIEAVALLLVFVVLVSYGVGFFGVIHTGILNSISARAYAWETFRHRADVTYFRANQDQSSNTAQNFTINGARLHATVSEKAMNRDLRLDFWATARKIAFAHETDGGPDNNHKKIADQTDDRVKVFGVETLSVDPVWVRTTYGICLNARCGR